MIENEGSPDFSEQESEEKVELNEYEEKLDEYDGKQFTNTVPSSSEPKEVYPMLGDQRKKRREAINEKMKEQRKLVIFIFIISIYLLIFLVRRWSGLCK